VPLFAPRGGIPLSIYLSHATLCRVGLTVTGRAGSATVCSTWRDSIVYPSVSCYSLPRRFDCYRKSGKCHCPMWRIPLSIHLSHATLCRVGLTVTQRVGSATVCPTWRESIVHPCVSRYSLPRRFDCDRKSGKCHCLPHVEGYHCLSI
jgi:hypothetical protein